MEPGEVEYWARDQDRQTRDEVEGIEGDVGRTVAKRLLEPVNDLSALVGRQFNTGDGIRMALEAGAASRGNWSGCHAVAWDMHAPDFGDLDVGDNFQKHSYPLGVMLNAQGPRFVDEGADFRNYTYAKYGGEILRHPGQFAWQIFDAKVAPLRPSES